MPRKDPEKKKEYDRQWKKRNRERLRGYQSEWRKSSASYIKWAREYLSSGKFYENRAKYRKTPGGKLADRKSTLKRKHNMTLAEFDDLLMGQGGVCAICKGKDWTKHGPAVDHDHRSGKIRGILCYRCNLAVGLMKDNPETIMSAFLYVSKDRGGCNQNEREKC